MAHQEPVEAVNLMLGLYNAPALARDITRLPLPDGMSVVIRAAAGHGETLDQLAVTTGRDGDMLQQAAALLLQQVLFHDGADSYRRLGVCRNATDQHIKEHHRWLMRWLHPDRDPHNERSVFAELVNSAWNDVRTPARRLAYDDSIETAPAPAAPAPHYRTGLQSLWALGEQANAPAPVLSGRFLRRLPEIVLGSVAALAVIVFLLAWYLMPARTARPPVGSAAPVAMSPAHDFAGPDQPAPARRHTRRARHWRPVANFRDVRAAAVSVAAVPVREPSPTLLPLRDAARFASVRSGVEYIPQTVPMPVPMKAVGPVAAVSPPAAVSRASFAGVEARAISMASRAAAAAPTIAVAAPAAPPADAAVSASAVSTAPAAIRVAETAPASAALARMHDQKRVPVAAHQAAVASKTVSSRAASAVSVARAPLPEEPASATKSDAPIPAPAPVAAPVVAAVHTVAATTDNPVPQPVIDRRNYSPRLAALASNDATADGVVAGSPTAPAAAGDTPLITPAEASSVVDHIVEAYGRGDMHGILNLFASDIDRAERRALIERYRNAFHTSADHTLLVHDLAWWIRDRTATGFGRFEVILTPRDGSNLRVSRGDFRIKVRIDGDEPRIVHLAQTSDAAP
jgi:hypothetical protein